LRQSTFWRALLASTVTLSLAAQAATKPNAGHADTGGAAAGGTAVPSHIHSGGLSAAEVTRLAQDANQHVIIILNNQRPDLPARGATRSMRAAAIAKRTAAITSDLQRQAVLDELAQVQAPRVRAYTLINAVAATVSSAEEARLKNPRYYPQVRAVVPDRVINAPRPAAGAASEAAVAPSAPTGGPAIPSPSCTNGVSLEPEALQLTNTAFTDTAKLSAQSIVTGTGVTVGYIADGIDPNNPDFIRPDGTKVFKDYQDFSGDGPNAPTAAGEAFGDAS